MEKLIEYWYIFVAVVAVLVMAIMAVYGFIKTPKSEQISKIEEWLEYAVVAAEKELGSGTGQIKLRMVYDMFVGRFPSVAQIITFDSFSIMVDNALVNMREMFKTNKSLSNYVNGTGNIE